MKVGDIVLIKGKKYMVQIGDDCRDCDCGYEEAPCPEECDRRHNFNRLCDLWDEEKNECVMYSCTFRYKDSNGVDVEERCIARDCHGYTCPRYQVSGVRRNKK